MPKKQNSRTQSHNISLIFRAFSAFSLLLRFVCSFIQKPKDFFAALCCSTTEGKTKNALILPRMWRRNAVHFSYEVLFVQELRAVSHPPRTARTARETATKVRDRRRREKERTTRIPEVVAEQQEEVANARVACGVLLADLIYLIKPKPVLSVRGNAN